jgi:hypothetical protein
MKISVKIFDNIFTNQNQQHIKKIIHYNPIGFISEMQELFNIHKPINIMQTINRIKGKNHRMISIAVESL